MDTEKKWYSVPEAAKIIGFSGQTIRNFIKSGRLRGYRLTPKAHFRIEAEALAALMEEKTHG